MFLPFDQMNKNSRVWIYTANRELTEEEIDLLQMRLMDFTENWLSHGSPVNASFDIKYKHFIVVAADESSEQTGGCSVDSLFGLIKQLEQDMGITLLDRQILSFLINTKVIQLPFTSVKTKLNQLESTDKKIFFNNLVANLEQLDTQWLVEPNQSWIKTYL